MKAPKLTSQQIQGLSSFIKIRKKSNEVKRAQAVLLVDREADIKDIALLTDLSRSQIFNLRKQYLEKGITALTDKREGRPKELLTQKERTKVIQILEKKTPKEFGFSTLFWNTGILGAVIQEKYGVHYKSKTSYYLLFKQAKFTYHKPSRVYEKRDEAEVQKWRATAKIKVNQARQEPDTVILVEDEMSLSTQTTTQKIWLPQGDYPKIEVATKRAARSIYGFLNIKNGKECAFKTKWQNMYITYEVLGKLRVIYPTQKIFLIWDKAPWHKGSKAQQFIKEDGNIETLDFPRAAPEENPQEHVWKNGRSHVTHNKFIENIDNATEELITYLNATKFSYEFLGFSPIS